MAAIAGVLAFDDGLDLRAIAGALGERMAHRAPDGQRLHVDRGIALLHGALHATPECHSASQPIACGDWVIAVDGRIDDRFALARALGFAPADLAGVADATLFVRAWHRWGAGFWEHVVGDFALAAWDTRARTLHLVRDRVGVRPLYVARTARLLAFASEQEALAGVPGISGELDDDRVAYYLAPAFVDDDPGATWLRDVRRLQPGERLEADSNGEVAMRRYWRMSPAGLEAGFADAGEAAEAFRAVFDAAVACRLRTAERPGLMLSGGVDSAAVLAASMRLQRSHGGSLPRPVSILDATRFPDETANILTAARHADDPVQAVFPAHAASPSFQRFAADFWGVADGWSASALPRLAYRLAAESGLRVMLDGIDGDLAMWAPTDASARMLLGGRPRAAWRDAAATARHHTHLLGRSPAGILASGVARQLQPRWMRSLRRAMSATRGIGHRFGPAIHPAFARALALPSRQRALAREAARAAAGGTREALLHAWWSPGLTRAMEGFDAMAGREGIEPRHPWADLRVLEFLLALPDALRLQDGWTKPLARAITAPELGPDVAWHSGKAHFGPVVVDALLAKSAEPVRRFVSTPSDWLESRVSPAHLAHVRAAAETGGDTALAYDILDVAALQAWRARLQTES